MIMAKDSNNNYVKIEDIKQQNSFNGVSPIEFKGSGENLENYRIYGNTVGGESVGDRTGNLFDYTKTNRQIGKAKEDGQLMDSTASNYFEYYIPVNPNTTYLFSSTQYSPTRIYYFSNSKQWIGRSDINNNHYTMNTYTFTTPNDCYYIQLQESQRARISERSIMLVEGSTALPFEPYGYKVPVTVSNGTDTLTTPIYLPEQIRKVGDEAEYIDYGEQKLHRVRKNLLPNTATSQTINGVAFTVNSDGSVTCNGTANNTTVFIIHNFPRFSGECILSGCPMNGSQNTYRLQYTNARDMSYKDYGTGCNIYQFDETQYLLSVISIRIENGYICDNLTFYPMIRKADIDDDTYEPYIENTELDVTLPALPTFSGTNILSVETNTKPSKVWDKLSDPRDILYVKDNLGNILFSKYHEIENVPPLTYKAIEGTLKNYRIYGQTVDGESVGDRTGNLFDMKKFAETCNQFYATVNYINNTLTFTATNVDAYVNAAYDKGMMIYDADRPSCIDVLPSTTYTISMSSAPKCYISWINSSYEVVSTYTQIPANQSSYTFTTPEDCTKLLIRFGKYVTNIGDTFTISDIMLNSGSTALPYEPYGYKVLVTVEGKNLLQNAATSQTIAGVTFTVNEDGSVTCNGTSTSQYYSLFRIPCYLVAGNYTISGCPVGGASKKYRADIRISPNGGMVGTDADIGAGATIPIDESGWYDYTIRIQGGYLVDDVTFKPMIRKADITDDTYEPYRTPVTTPIYLPEPIKMVGDEAEYIDYGEQKLHRVSKNLFNETLYNKNVGNNTLIYVPIYVGNIDYVTCSTTCPKEIDHDNDDFNSRYIFILSGNVNTGALNAVNGVSNGAPRTIRPSNGYVTIAYRKIESYNVRPWEYQTMLNVGSTALPYEPYEVDVTLPALSTLPGINVLSVGTEVQPSKINIKGKIKGKIYGWHVDPDISDSSNAVTYLEDAIGMTPASMGSTTFDYGSWENAFFMPKPCMLKSNGKVDYYLDPNDYTKKLNGTASDISNPNYDGNAMMQWPKIWFKYVKGVKEGQGYFYVANYKADGNFHCWCNYDSENNEIDHFYTAIYNGTSFANYSSSETYVINDFAIYDNKLYKCNTNIATTKSFDNTKWDLVSNTAPAIDKMRSLSDVRLTNNNGNAKTDTTTEVTRATANNTTSAAEWYIETFSDRLLINGLLVLMGKSLNTQAVFGRGLYTGGWFAKENYVTGTLNDKGLFWGATENGNSGVKVFGMENFWGCCWHRTAGLIINNHAVKLKLTYGKKDGSAIIGYNQAGHGYIDNGTAPYSSGYVQKMSYNKYGFMPAVVTGGSQSTYYADYYYQNANYTGTIYALFGGNSNSDADLRAGAFSLNLNGTPGAAIWDVAASLSCKPLLN